ncbi:thioredoxin domain-containing protein [bacterium]|nr:thioredoxin domain-containing protein [bacterium]
MAKKRKTSKKFKLNPWMITSIVLVIILGLFIAYDKSVSFKTFVNNTFGIETGPSKIGVAILEDSSIENPPYDIAKNMDKLQDEIGRELKIKDVDISSDEGKKYVKDYDLKTLPVLFFDKEIDETDFYTKSASFFTEEGDTYMVKLQPYKYLQIPTAGDAQHEGATPGEAPVTIIEYSSFTCPHCADMKDVMNKVMEEYPDKVSYVYKNFDRGGPDEMLSNAAECAGEHDKFWEMNAYLMDNQADLKDKKVPDFIDDGAKKLGIKNKSFDTCISENKYADKIKAQTDEALEFGVNGTPGFFVNDNFIGGAVPYEKMKSVIDSFLQ